MSITQPKEKEERLKGGSAAQRGSMRVRRSVIIIIRWHFLIPYRTAAKTNNTGKLRDDLGGARTLMIDVCSVQVKKTWVNQSINQSRGF